MPIIFLLTIKSFQENIHGFLVQTCNSIRPFGSGYHEIKVNELPDGTWSELRITERLSLPVVLIFAVMHSPFKHALRKESTIKHSVDYLELFDSQRRKSARIIGFLLSHWSGFRQLKHRVQKR